MIESSMRSFARTCVFALLVAQGCSTNGPSADGGMLPDALRTADACPLFDSAGALCNLSALGPGCTAWPPRDWGADTGGADGGLHLDAGVGDAAWTSRDASAGARDAGLLADRSRVAADLGHGDAAARDGGTTAWGDAGANARCPAGTACLVVPTYAALRAYSGDATALCVIQPRICGRFERVGACVVDDGVCLAGVAGRRWQRVLGSPPVLRPSYWETSDATIAVRAASTAARDLAGAVVELDRVYEVYRSMPVYSGVTYRGGGLRRRCTPQAKVTAPAAASDNCLQVNQTSGFVPYTQLLVLRGAGYRKIAGEIWPDRNIASDRFCTRDAVPLGYAAAVGQDVVEVFDLLQGLNPSGLAGHVNNVTIRGMVFDGNRACNGYTADWRYNTVGAVKGDVTFVDNTIVDTPSEALTICGGTWRNNRARNLGGSFVHKSCGMTPPPVDRLEGNVIEGVNLLGDALMGHSEGAITLSANAGELVVRDNIFRDGREGVFGLVNGNDTNILARGNVFERFARRISYTPDLTAASEGIDIDTGNTWSEVP